MIKYFNKLVLLQTAYLLCFIGLSAQIKGQLNVYPPEIYPGENILRVTNPNGLKSVEVYEVIEDGFNGAERRQLDESLMRTEVEKIENPNCGNEIKFKVKVKTINERIGLRINAVDCKNKKYSALVWLNEVWRIDFNRMPSVEVGTKSCMAFSIRTEQSTGVILDSISLPDQNVEYALPMPLPCPIRSKVNFQYEVCYNSDKAGVFKFPVVTWLRRKYPIDGLTSYAIADTGLAFFYEPKLPEKDPVLSIPDTIKKITKTVIEEVETDPTTFRTVLIPNAYIPKAGKFYFGSYDILGLTAGYSVTDNLMIIAGALVPSPDDWQGPRGDMFSGLSVGLKYGLSFGKFNIAAGYQFARSVFDKGITKDSTESVINMQFGYIATSYGSTESRLSLNVGYAIKKHSTYILYFDDNNDQKSMYENYNRNAAFASIGFDKRVGGNFKLCTEAIYMHTSNSLPIVFTGRYFTNDYGLDLGVAYTGITFNGSAAPKIPFAPILSLVYVW